MTKAPHVLVTGGGRGIGRALCAAALSRGWRVSTTVRSGDAVPGCVMHRLDLHDLSTLPALSGAVGPLDILINNAGVIGPDVNTLAAPDAASFLDVFRINTLGPLAVTQSLLPNLRAAPTGFGRVLSISSQMAWMGYAKSDHIAYRASKAALNKVMQGMATDLAPLRIAAVSVDPGWVRTDMGGPKADLDAGQVAEGILDLASRMTMAQTGQFLRHDGKRRDW
ncbi:MAG: SDR family NAD(P)-dependent oxidoreductase [Rhodobacteraceae bacterium]|nr:SDR family NAD(P)-dependent oxidoreductase [Paracoccaceae bacterium]